MRIFSKINAIHRPVKIVISYAKADAQYCQELQKYLKILERNNLVAVWDESMIRAGAVTAQEVYKKLNEADLILVLLSADYINNDFCWDVEMRIALRKHALGEAVVIPVLIRPIAIALTPFSHLRLSPLNGVPLNSSNWSNLEDGYLQVLEEVVDVVQDFEKYLATSRNDTNVVHWILYVEGEPADFPARKIRSLTEKLRKITGDDTIVCLAQVTGSVGLLFQSKPNTYFELEQGVKEKILGTELGLKILSLSSQYGARIKFQISEVDLAVDPIILEKKEITGVNVVDLSFPPFLGGMVLDYDSPISPGFLLYSDHKSAFDQNQLNELQARLGRYLNTCLIVESKYLHVDLNPLKPYAGLHAVLQKTEFGRDLLEADLHLKKVTSQLLHPNTDIGVEFWRRIDDAGVRDYSFLKNALRLWIVPGKSEIKEKMIEPRKLQASLEKFRLEVKFEFEHLSEPFQTDPNEDILLKIFAEVIIPEIQKHVDWGSAFGTLRQLYTITLFAHWLEEKFKGSVDFINSNNIKPYEQEEVAEQIKFINDAYLNLYNNGEWKTTRKQISSDGTVRDQVMIIGRIDLSRALI